MNVKLELTEILDVFLFVFSDSRQKKMLLESLNIPLIRFFTYCLQFTEDCRADMYPPPSTESKVGTFVLNLDLAPEDRWTPLVKNKTTEVINLISEMYKSLQKITLRCKHSLFLF